MTEVSVYEARNNLSKLIKEAQAGNEVTITSRGIPVARLVAPERDAQLDFVQWLRDHRPPVTSHRSVDEIEAAIATEREGWE